MVSQGRVMIERRERAAPCNDTKERGRAKSLKGGRTKPLLMIQKGGRATPRVMIQKGGRANHIAMIQKGGGRANPFVMIQGRAQNPLWRDKGGRAK